MAKTYSQIPALHKLGDELERIYGSGKMPKNFSQSDVTTLHEVFFDLFRDGKANFIQKNIADFLQKTCKINVRPYGIGYMATIKK